jgi:hypothetical protein
MIELLAFLMFGIGILMIVAYTQIDLNGCDSARAKGAKTGLLVIGILTMILASYMIAYMMKNPMDYRKYKFGIHMYSFSMGVALTSMCAIIEEDTKSCGKSGVVNKALLGIGPALIVLLPVYYTCCLKSKIGKMNHSRRYI